MGGGLTAGSSGKRNSAVFSPPPSSDDGTSWMPIAPITPTSAAIPSTAYVHLLLRLTSMTLLAFVAPCTEASSGLGSNAADSRYASAAGATTSTRGSASAAPGAIMTCAGTITCGGIEPAGIRVGGIEPAGIRVGGIEPAGA